MSRNGRPRRIVGLVLFAGLLAAPFAGLAVVLTAGPAGAAITNFTDGSIGIVGGIVGGPDGGVWFTNQNRNTIGRIDASTQTVTEYMGTGISQPTGIALGPDGALWFTNKGNNSIGRIDPSTHAVTNYTGTGIDHPAGIAAGPDGNMWFTNDVVAGSIGMINVSNHVVANYTSGGFSGTDDPNAITAGPDGRMWFTNDGNNSIGAILTNGSGSIFNWSSGTVSNPQGIAAGSDGALWFTNEGNNSIGRIDTGGSIGNFTDPGISSPVGIAAGSDGALWFGDSGPVGRITTTGHIDYYNGDENTLVDPTLITNGPDGALWFTNPGRSSGIGRIAPDVVSNFPDASISHPGGITAGPDGALWFVNETSDSIGRIDTSGVVTNHTGTGISLPYGIVTGPDGALWFTNVGNDSIGRIDPGTYAVTNYTDASISGPLNIVVGPDGALWFPNEGNDSIGRIDPSTHVVTGYGDASISQPSAIAAGPDGALWFTNQGSSTIGRIDPVTHAVTNYTDGSISNPTAITSGPDGALWFVDNGTDSIGRITTAGAVTNYTDASIAGPSRIVAGPDGALWFTNLNNNSIGRITTGGTVSNYADASISHPVDITTGPDGALWFTNFTNDSIGRLAPVGAITAYYGQGASSPASITSGPDGALWFLNGGDNTIVRMTTGGTVTDKFSLGGHVPDGLTSGPDGALWFTSGEDDALGRLTTGGALTYYTVDSPELPPGSSWVTGITAGPDGDLWFTNSEAPESIGQMDPSGNMISNTTDSGLHNLNQIISGPDGGVWFLTNNGNASVGRIDPTTHAITYVSDPSLNGASSITVGPDGALWVTDGTGHAISRIDPGTGHVAGVFTNGSIGNGSSGITAGGDGALWFIERDGAHVGRMTTDGAVTEIADPNMNDATSMTQGPDGALYYTNAGNNSVGRTDAQGVANGPTDVSPTGGNGQVSLSWTPPVSTGGLTITDYSVSVLDLDDAPATDVTGPTTRLVGSATPNFVFTGLTNGTGYKFAVATVNAAGTGTAARSPAVVPATVPGAPTGVSAVGGVGSARVSFSAPGSTGGNPITHYDASCTSSNGGVSGAGGGSTSPVMVTGLSSGKSYACAVTATNSVGTGAASTASNSVTVGGSKLITVGTAPGAVSSDGTHVWVANVSDNTVTEIDASDGSVVQTIPVGTGPDAVSSDGTHVWVANSFSSTVTELNASDGSFVQSVAVGLNLTGISSDGTHVWVASNFGHSVLELNASDGSIVGQVNGIVSPYSVSSDGSHVWVTDRQHNLVAEVNPSDRSVVQTIATGTSPTSVSSDGTHVWIANESVSDNSVTELNASDGSLVNTIAVGSEPVSVWSDGVRVWVANVLDNTVTELNASDGSLVRTVPVGSEPDAVVSDGVHVWVANAQDNTVTELNAADTSLLAPGAPASVSGNPSDGQVTVSWSPPASNGGSAITDYAVSVFNSSGGPATGVTGTTTRLVGSNTTNLTFTGLTDETVYRFKVAAVNAAGTGAQSALSSTFTPFTVPGAPTAVVGTSGNGQVVLSWAAPSDNGGSAITDYQVSVLDSGGGTATGVTGLSTRSVGSPATSYTFTGLTNATAYTFEVAAVNAAGAGAQSALSAATVASTFNVPALIPNPGTAGFDSGYAVNNSVTIGATGTWCPDALPADCGGPDGTGAAAASGSLLPGAGGQYALVGRIGTSGAWTLIGSGPITLNGKGELYLAMNDQAGQFANNSGSLQVSVAPLDGVTGTTPPVSSTLTSGYDAAWSVPIINDSGVPITGVSATVHANANGPVALPFDTAIMPGCTAVGNSDVCSLPDVPAHSTYLFNVYVPTTGLLNNRTITGDVAVSAAGGLNASGNLGTVTIVSCGTSCVVAVAPPGTPVSSPAPTSPISAPQQTVTLPATQTGSTPEPVAVTLSTITPSSSLPASDQKLCPTASGQTHCSGKISSVVADFSKFNDSAHPIQIKIVTDWGSSVPAGRILMEKKTGGDPLFLLTCRATAPYNTPCLKSETTSGAAGNRTTTDTIFITGLDIHFARRVSSGGGTVIKPPAAPTGLTVAGGSASAKLTWKAPTVTNGAGVTSYVVTVLAAGKVVKTVNYPSPALTQTVTGLTNGKAYTFKVAAGNVAGNGAATPVSAAMVDGAPGAPTAVRAVKFASGQIQVTFTPPAATNGAAISSYTGTCTSSNSGVTKTKTGAASPLTVTALSAGKTYKCTVKATNSRGAGPPSAASAAVVA